VLGAERFEILTLELQLPKYGRNEDQRGTALKKGVGEGHRRKDRERKSFRAHAHPITGQRGPG